MNPRPPKKPPKAAGTYYKILDDYKTKQAKKGKIVAKKKVKF